MLEAVYIKDRTIGRAEFSEVFAPLFFRPSSNKALKVEVGGIEPSKEWRTWFLTLETRPAASVILIIDERTCVR